MMKCCKTLFIVFLALIVCRTRSAAQACSNLGQTPSTAFPVCGTATFSQQSVPICGGKSIPTNCGGGNINYSNMNPYWYKFTCYTTGTLGFTITPKILQEDYDWQIWDITGKNPDDVFTDKSLIVCYNWSGEFGVTGTSSSANSLYVCGGKGQPLFSSMPTLQKDHQYLLLISHFDETSLSGYDLKFGGGTANITDPLEPALKSISSGCDAMSIRVKLNKSMKCLTIAPDGSDFTITGNPVITSATGNNCSSSFDMDEVILKLKDPLPPGKYTVTIKKGSDGNTLKDNCDREVPENQSLEVEILPLIPMNMDSITPVACKPNTLNVVFRRLVFLNSADPSDFVLTGPEARSVVAVKGINITDNMSYTLQLQLNAPIQTGGNWMLTLKKGNDGNTLLDECGTEVNVGTKSFVAYDTVNANFQSNINYSCTVNTVSFSHNGAHNVNIWSWVFPDGSTVVTQSVQKTFSEFSPKQIALAVSNGVCKDSITQTVTFDNELKAAFDVSRDSLCPGEALTLTNNTIGNVIKWQWNFNDGTTAAAKSPNAHVYPTPQKSRDYIVQLSATNNYGCTDVAAKTIKVLQSCYVDVPSAFTPNGDGLNDYLYPLNGFKASKLLFRVYNRLGQLVFQTTDWNKRWDGRINGQPQPTGTYVWIFEYTDSHDGKQYVRKGTTVLIR